MTITTSSFIGPARGLLREEFWELEERDYAGLVDSEDSAQSETPGMHGNSTRENRETPSTPVAEDAAGRSEKAMSQESNMHAGGSRTVAYYRRSA
jgi:hypothetical protein